MSRKNAVPVLPQTTPVGAARTLLLGLFALGLAGCSSDVADPAAASNLTSYSVEPPHIASALAMLPEFAKLRRMLNRAGLMPMLANQRATITLFAPRDSALAQIDPETRAALVNATPPDQLARTLRALMVPRTISADELRTRIIDGGGSYSVPSMAGTPLQFRLAGDQLLIVAANGNNATIGNSAIATGNGTIYVLDRWIGPSS